MYTPAIENVYKSILTCTHGLMKECNFVVLYYNVKLEFYANNGICVPDLNMLPTLRMCLLTLSMIA